STRHSHGDSSTSSNYLTSCKGLSLCNPHWSCPRRRGKYAACSENHGIRPPAPEQYLTPLQQKEVCIRHLRARLKENVERLQDRDSEIEDLRMQLTRMQEDWIEEECHRIEAQLALKEARKEIQQLQQAVDTVRTNLASRDSDQPDFQSDGVIGGRLGLRLGASRSCGCSPARTINRSATFTRLRSETPPGTDHNDNVPFEVHTPASRRATTLPRGDGRTHLLLEAALLSEQVPHTPLCSTLSRLASDHKPAVPRSPGSQKKRVVGLNEEHGMDVASTEEGELEQAPQRSHWSRYFLIDLLAVAVPVVPTVAWLCRRTQDEGVPMYHMGSLLRGCCAVALHSLRRVSSSRAPTGTGGATTV
uniref:Syntaphilin a n=1 Tax=Electrophorus electricus TaxID=8005 RepID=A0A4W4DYR0_ELEEL